MSNSEISREKMLARLERPVWAAMKKVKSWQLSRQSVATDTKTDGTFVTTADKESGRILFTLLKIGFPDANFEIENVDSGADRATTKHTLRILADPHDGTQAFKSGLMTSTVIAAIYDETIKAVTACVTGLTATGQLWLSIRDGGCCILQESEIKLEIFCHVSERPLDKLSTVLLDVNHGFARDGRQILGDKQVCNLMRELQRHKMLMPGSNGLHQALVADGKSHLAGAITTAIGGPWDVCGVLHVLEAGGAAKAFKVEWHKVVPSPLLTETNPLDVMSYDLLIVGNNQPTVDKLEQYLRAAVHPEIDLGF